MDQTLSWGPQVGVVKKKCSFSLHSLVRARKFLPVSVRKLLVKTLIFPILDYCDIVFTNLTIELSHKLQVIQNSCVRFIFDIKLKDRIHIQPKLLELNWLSIENRRKLHLLSSLFSVLKFQIPNYLFEKFISLDEVSNRPRRLHNLLLTPRHTSEQYSKSYHVTCCRLWNNLPDALRVTEELKSFKKLVEQNLQGWMPFFLLSLFIPLYLFSLLFILFSFPFLFFSFLFILFSFPFLFFSFLFIFFSFPFLIFSFLFHLLHF